MVKKRTSMTFCRYDEESDVYVYENILDNIVVEVNTMTCNIDKGIPTFSKNNLQYNGDIFQFDNIPETKEMLFKLKELGYKIPNTIF